MDTKMHWQQAVAMLHAAGEGMVLVTILETQGSAPRDEDSKMVVARDRLYDSIGGGQLEYRAIGIGRELLDKGRACKRMEEFPLGPELNQCCGGRVKLLFECMPGCDLKIELHGAGHVARALTTLLGEIDCRVRLIDERADFLCKRFPANVDPVHARAAAAEVDNAPPDAWYLVMTHSHSLDLEICDAILSRGDFRYLGLIGSRSKAARFRKRLAERGFDDAELRRLNCPIGLKGVGGKAPMEIAISVSADILKQRDRESAKHLPSTSLELVRR
jgi:xanthine dehydrogenase accessory factor